MFDKIRDIERFLTIVETGSLHEAAARLEVSQPNLSRVLKRMEEQCEGQLFDRLPRGLALTPLGELVTEKCRHLLRECELASDDIRSAVGGRSGHLRLSAGPVWIFAILPQVLPGLNDAFPDVRLSLSSRGFHDAVKLLEQGHLDAHVGGFDSEAPLPVHLLRIPLMDVRLGVVALEGHPIFSSDMRVERLADYPWIDYGAGRRTDAHVWPGAEDIQAEVARKTGRRFRTIVECDASGLALMRAEPYLAYLPITIAENIPGLPLKRVPIELDEQVFRSGLVVRKSLMSNPIVQMLIESHRRVLKER
eukprot:g17304.t1